MPHSSVHGKEEGRTVIAPFPHGSATNAIPLCVTPIRRITHGSREGRAFNGKHGPLRLCISMEQAV